jgi:uncharacterized metal-binding protein
MEDTENAVEYDCVSCEHHLCREGVDCCDLADRANALYGNADAADMRITKAAAKVEAEGYMRWPRALEIIRFAEAAGYSHLGIAFCIGLTGEARTYQELLEKRFVFPPSAAKTAAFRSRRYSLNRSTPASPTKPCARHSARRTSSIRRARTST